MSADLPPRDRYPAPPEFYARKPTPAAPYPFCRTPAECSGKGYCPKEFACND